MSYVGDSGGDELVCGDLERRFVDRLGDNDFFRSDFDEGDDDSFDEDGERLLVRDVVPHAFLAAPFLPNVGKSYMFTVSISNLNKGFSAGNAKPPLASNRIAGVV